jgi:putative ABC transport system substrate-binding protein
VNRRRLLVGGIEVDTAVAIKGRLAQGAAKRDAHVGYLELVKESDGALLYREFFEEFEAAGYVSGRNLKLTRKSAGGATSRLATLAAELAALKVDLILASSTDAARSAKFGAPKTPVVFVISGDPVLEGLVKTLARPEGMLTGITTYSVDLTAKRLQILKEAFPNAHKVAVVGSSSSMSTVAVHDAARALQLEIQQYLIHATADYRDTAVAITRGTTDAVLVVENVDAVNNVGAFVRLMMATRRPVMFNSDLFVDEFGLMSYGVSMRQQYRRAARIAARILEGAKASDTPVELPIRYELVVNARSAEEYSIVLPRGLLLRADRVIR